MSERETLESCFTRSIARYGDGEFKLMIGRKCVSQVFVPKLQQELRRIVEEPGEVLPAVPNVWASPRVESWKRYTAKPFDFRYSAQHFGSSLITRPDSAPWIDTPDYWERVCDLWRGKDVTIVVGDRRSLRPDFIETQATSVRLIEDLRPIAEGGWRQHAYQFIDQIEEAIGTPAGPVLMCLGATATVLAARLARKGVHALDLGHIGMFMRHAGIYRYQLRDLISDDYRAQLFGLRSGRQWGDDGAKHAAVVRDIIEDMQPETVLDYGCGEQRLAAALAPVRVQGYDPGIEGREGMPKPVDLVVCTDVLEHIEPAKLDAVLDHIFRLAGKGAYLVIALRPANAVLPNGSNAHLIVQPAAWWLQKIKEQGWKGPHRIEEAEGRELRLWLRK